MTTWHTRSVAHYADDTGVAGQGSCASAIGRAAQSGCALLQSGVPHNRVGTFSPECPIYVRDTGTYHCTAGPTAASRPSTGN